MGSWMTCKCGARIHLNMFSGTHIYQLIEDSDYDAVEDPIDRNKLEDLFLKKGITVYPCLSCGRLFVEWNRKGGLTVYLPEENQEIPRSKTVPYQAKEATQEDQGTAEALESEERDQPDDPQLNKLEAMAEAAYDEMYDSRRPGACYSDAKEALYSAIELAERLGRKKDVKRLQKRLQHIKDVFRHQFTF
jgi:hypothetical protein